VLHDVKILKKMDNDFIDPDKSGYIQGFIQDIHTEPFGFLMLSQIQVSTDDS
jgi:hypothetical protein